VRREWSAEASGESKSEARKAQRNGLAVSGYDGSLLQFRMSVLNRMIQLGMTRRELADAAGIGEASVLEAYLHTPEELARLAVALDWPPAHFAYFCTHCRRRPPAGYTCQACGAAADASPQLDI
jgi:hypothetical protein